MAIQTICVSLDKQGVVVGLIEKGMAKKDETGFVQEGIDS